jgi:hypothetical protein
MLILQALKLWSLVPNKYPFKSPSLPFVEIFNYFSHSESNITIYLAENTIHKLTHEGNFIMNLDTVAIKTYSPAGNETPSKATLEIKGDIGSIFSSLTKFNVISDATLKPDVYALSENVTQTERDAVISSGGKTINVLKSNFSLKNLIITSK